MDVDNINDPAPPAQVACEQLCAATGRLERLGTRRVNCAAELLTVLHCAVSCTVFGTNYCRVLFNQK